MMIEKTTSKYYIWDDGRAYVVTPRYNRNYLIFRGTLEECEWFIAKNPHGVKETEARKLAEQYN